MPQTYGAWRVTYSPGSWVVMSGPSSLVVLPPAPPSVSPRLNDLWDDILETASIQEVIARMGAIGLNHLTHVAVFFWDSDGMHSLVRGDIEVLDLSTGRVLNTGQGVVMWREAGIASRLVRITMQAVDQNSVVQLPLVVGSVNASAIVVDATATTSVDFPPLQAASHTDSGEYAALTAPVAQPPAPSAPPPPPAAAPPVPAAPAPAVVPPAPNSPQWAPAAAEREPASASYYPEASSAPSVVFDDSYASVPGGPETRSSGASERSGYIPQEAEPAWQPADSAATGSWQSSEAVQQDGRTVFYTDLAASHKPGEPEADRDGQVVAAFCSQGHPNQPDAQRCRVCLLPVDSAHPRYISRPSLGVLRSSSGSAAPIVGTIVVGRAPTATGDDEGAQLMRVPSPSQDISRSHVRVATHGWSIEATDLHSTNGTVVRYPGEAPVRLKRGETVTVEPGTILELGDGVTLEVSGE